MNHTEIILQRLCQDVPALLPLKEKIYQACALMIHCYENNGQILLCGNGGSAADAEHIVGELMKGFLCRRALPAEDKKRFESEGVPELAEQLQQALPAVSLVSQSALCTAFANDVAADLVFAQQVYAYGKGKECLLIALSTSGNARNVVNAVRTARSLGIPSLGITGRDGGRLGELCTVCIQTPEKETYRVQELTLPVYHALCAVTEAHFFKE